MRATRFLLPLSVSALLLVGCGGGADTTSPGEGGSTAPSASATASTAGWSEEQCAEASMADWTEHCSGQAGGDSSALDENVDTSKPQVLGKVAHTVGGQSFVDSNVAGGELDLTPTSVIYHENDGVQWATIVLDVENNGAVPASQTAPISGRSWQLILPDRTTRATAESQASDGSPADWACGGVIQSGLKQHCAFSIDLPDGEGTSGLQLMYLDGDGAQYRWTLPEANEGPHVQEYLQALTA